MYLPNFIKHVYHKCGLKGHIHISMNLLFSTGKRVVIEGVEYPITHQMYALMKYFEYSETIDSTDIHIINTIATETWKMILKIIDDMKGHFPVLPSIVTNNTPRDYLCEALVLLFEKIGMENLNDFHKACQYLKFDALKKAIAIFLACKVYFTYSLKGYQ